MVLPPDADREADIDCKFGFMAAVRVEGAEKYRFFLNPN